MSAPVIWRALQPCMVAGVYREAGEVFCAPDGDYAPDVRVKVGEQTDAPGVPHASTPQEKPLAKMNAAELAAKAAELGLTFPANVKSNADKAAYIAAKQAATAAPGVTPDDLPDV